MRWYVPLPFAKRFLHERLCVDPDNTGSITFFRSNSHRLLCEHVRADLPQKTEGKGGVVYEWMLPSHKPDNHWFDNLVHCGAGAAYEGISAQYTTPRKEKKKEVVFSELQKQRRRERGMVGAA